VVVKTPIKALWFDDEWESDEDFIDTCLKKHSIQITAYKSRIPGLKYLKENYLDIDIVILDAWFTAEDDQIYDDSGSQATMVKNEVGLLEKDYPLEIFVYTATERGKLFTNTFPDRIYIKAEDEERMFRDIHDWYNSRSDIKIRKHFRSAFDVCNDDYIGEKSGDLLLKILRNEEDYNLNYVRQILEALFDKYKKLDLVPKNLDFAQTSRFLSGGVENNFQLKESSRLPTPVSETLRCIIRTVNPGSHYTSDEELKKDVDKYLTNKYSKKAIVLLLIDVLIDFKRQVDNIPIKNNWNEIDSLQGEIIWLNPIRGNGRLKCDEHSNLFFYLNESENSEVLNLGDRVNFSMGKNSKGPMAKKVMKINNS
jgi:cold shock CspA family protein